VNRLGTHSQGNPEMNRIDAYLTVEKILAEYYFATEPKLDDLGSMLGDMDTSVWVPGVGEEIISGDPAVFAGQWTRAWNTVVGEEKDGAKEEIFRVAKVLIDYYTNEVEYDLGDAESYLRERLLL
jgi:hypothetical protein